MGHGVGQWSLRCPPFITTRWTRINRLIGKFLPIASSPSYPLSQQPPTSTRWANRSCIRVMSSTIAAICCTCSLPCRRPITPSTKSPRKPLICFSSCTLITSKTAARQQYAWLAGSGTNPYSAIAAGISALWGPAHGGANEAVINMLEEMGSVDAIPAYVARAKDKSDPFRLMGFGHRVYKSYDPRATIIREMCHRGAEQARSYGHTFIRYGTQAGRDRTQR